MLFSHGISLYLIVDRGEAHHRWNGTTIHRYFWEEAMNFYRYWHIEMSAKFVIAVYGQGRS